MNVRNVFLLALMGLGLTIVGLVGCERKVLPPEPWRWIPPTPTPATQIQVTITGASAADLEGTVVRLYAGGIRIAEQTVSGVTGTSVTITFDSLSVGTYQVAIRKSGYTVQSQLVSIVDETVPVAAFIMKKIENTTTISVQTATITEPTTPTTITIEPPPAVQEAAKIAAPPEVTVTGVSGDVTVAVTTGSEVPPVVEAGTVTSSVVGAVQVQVPQDAPEAKVTVSLPLPIDSTQVPQAVGGTVDVLKLNLETLTWEKIGTATIDSTGRATTTVTGLGQDNIIAVGAKPQVQEQEAAGTPTPVLDPSTIENLRQQGQTEVEYDLSPSVQVVAGKLSQSEGRGKAAIIPAPGGIPQWWWDLAAPVIAARSPELAAWINGNRSIARVPLPPLTAEFVQVRVTRSFSFEFTFGGVRIAFTIIIEYTKGEIRIISHSGGGGGG